MKVVKIIKKISFSLITAFILLVIYLPLYWMLSTSLKDPYEAFELPPKWIFVPKFDNYIATLSPGSGIFIPGAHTLSPKYFVNSAITSLSATVFVIIISLPAAYALSKYKIRGGGSIMRWILSTAMAPPIAMILPYYVLWKALNLIDAYPSLIFMYIILNLPLAIWILKGFFDDVPRELEEAALVDGAGGFYRFFYVTLPLTFPGVVVTAFFSLIISWNEFLFALILTGSNTATVPLGLYGFVSLQGIMWAQLCTSGTLYIIPPLVFIAIFRRRITRVMSLGVVRG